MPFPGSLSQARLPRAQGPGLQAGFRPHPFRETLSQLRESRPGGPAFKMPGSRLYRGCSRDGLRLRWRIPLPRRVSRRGIPLPEGVALGAQGCFSRAAPLLLVKVYHTVGFPPGYPAPEEVALGAVGCLSRRPSPSLANSPPTPGFPPGYPASRRGCSRCAGLFLKGSPALVGESLSHGGLPAGVSRPRRGCSRCGGVPLETAFAFAGECPSHAGLPAGASRSQRVRLPNTLGCFSRAAPLLLVKVYHTVGFPPGHPAPEGVALGAVGCLSGHATTMLIEAGTDVKFPGEKLGEKTVSFPGVL